MPVFQNLNIGTKIISAVVIASIAAAINMGVGLYFLREMNVQFGEAVDLNTEKIKLAAHVNRNMVEVGRAEKNIILATTQKEMDEYAENTKTYREELQERLGSLRVLADDDGKMLMDDYEENWTKYLKYNQKVRDLTRENSTRRAFLLSFEKGRQKLDRVEQTLDSLIKKLEQDVKNLKASEGELGKGYFDAVKKTLLIARIKQNLLSASRAEKNLILAKDQENQESAYEVFESENKEIKKRLKPLKDLIDEDGKIILDRFKELFQEWQIISKNVRELAVSDSNQKAIAISMDEGRKVFDEASLLMEKIVRKNQLDLA